jgi:hypothetical protein
MTSADKPVTRLTYASHRGKQIVVKLGPTWIEFRLKGRRARFMLDVQGAMERAMWLAAEQARRERRKLKLERRRAA